MQHYDTIIIGAGHNGLVCAAYLARSGQQVLVLEAGESPGGLASTREFHPGFKASVAHTINQFSPEIVADLNLSQHGYPDAGKALPTIGLDTDGNHVRVHDGIVSGSSADDARKYTDYIALLQRCAKALQPSWMKTMPRVGNNSLSELLSFAQVGVRLRLLGKKDMPNTVNRVWGSISANFSRSASPVDRISEGVYSQQGLNISYTYALGTAETAIIAPNDGMVIGRTNLPLVYEGDATFDIAEYGRKVGTVERHVEQFQEEHPPDTVIESPENIGDAPIT